MNVSEQKLNEVLAGIIENYGKKGSISTNALCDIMEKYDTNPNQIDQVYKALGDAGIQIVDEDKRDKELFEQALADIGLDDPVKMYLKDIHLKATKTFQRIYRTRSLAFVTISKA